MPTVLNSRFTRTVLSSAILTCAAWSVSAQQSTSASIQAPAQIAAEAREILSEMIASKSIHANGSTALAQKIAARLLAAGYSQSDVHVLAPAKHPSKANVVVRLRGSGKAKPVLYIGHLDVVDAKREDWNFDPFSLTEKDGWLYGRGTIDMLGQDSAMLASMLRLKRENYVPERDIIVAFTADEEAEGDANGVEWLLKEHRSLIDAGLVINPDAGEAAIKNGKKIYLTTQTSEKIFLSFGVEVTDKGGHSSRPTDQNPIYRLSKGLQRLSDFSFPLHLTDTVKLYFAGRSQLESGQKKADMLAISKANPPAAVVRRLSQEVETNIMLRTTCTATEISGGHAENALPQRAKATLQCRVIPGETQAQIEATLRRVLKDESIKISVMTAAKPTPESPPSPAIFKAVEQVTKSMWPEVIILPNMSAGASDSVFTRNAGLVTYGVDAMFDDLDDSRAHGRDERISVKGFNEEIEFVYRLMKSIAKLP
ncbi:M20/M25/M40 family metallo-hydrolase [Undibacterium sp. Ji22W]|uniref:M20/M25/M40 family metallo-hydrolase n=1 Tax=Undibacterium sp. Ji22W TaxID=3413038 RepID=UPI003BF2AF13